MHLNDVNQLKLSTLEAAVKAGLNCLYSMQQYTSSSPSSLMVIVDLGKDPRNISTRAGSSMLCSFQSILSLNLICSL